MGEQSQTASDIPCFHYVLNIPGHGIISYGARHNLWMSGCGPVLPQNIHSRETCQGSDRSSDRGGITSIELEINWELSVNPDLVIQLGKIAVTL